MTCFSPSFLSYFEALEANNTTAWFDANRRWYEREVKRPFEDFIDELIIRLKRIDPDINIEPSEAIFRINNDIRYTQEKIPYKPWMSANISAYGKRSKEYPGFYIQVNHERLILSGGVYAPGKETLYQLRQCIAQDPHLFREIIGQDRFVQQFGGLTGEQHKILPVEFRTAAEFVPEICFKQFYYRCELAPETMLQENIPSVIFNLFEPARELHLFLRRVFKTALAA